MTEVLEQLADVVRREIGMSIRGPALTSLEAALRRMDPTMDAAAFLRAGGEETAATALLERLIDEVTVKETFFFRQREEFDAIDWPSLHRAARAAGSETVRVWRCGLSNPIRTCARVASANNAERSCPCRSMTRS